MQTKIAPKILPRILSLFLVLATIFTILPQQAFASGNGFGPVDGSAATGGVGRPGVPSGGTTDGDWGEKRQGYRVTVLDHAGAPAFTFNGKNSIDIIFTTDSKFKQMDYYVDGTKSDNGKGTIKGSRDAMNTDYYTFAYLKDAFRTGKLGTITPMGTTNADGTPNAAGIKQKDTAINKLVNMPYPFTLYKNKGDTSWSVKTYSDEVRARLYGASEDIQDDSGLYALLNTYKLNGKNWEWLWAPKSTAFFTNGGWTEEEKESLRIPVGETRNGITGKTPIQIMGARGMFISVEPIIWNPLRLSGSQWSYGVYGTQTGVARAIDWLVEGGYFVQKNSAYGGYDQVIFGKGGRQAITLPSNLKANFPGWNFPDTGPKIYPWSMMPPTAAQFKAANNKDTMWLENGISIHLYHIGAAQPSVPSTSTCDEPLIPTPHTAPDPSKIPKLPDEQVDKTRVYNIVKTYRDRVLDESGSEVVNHVATYSRQKNPSKISIEDEKQYKVKEWFISETYNNPTSSTTWEDNHNQAPTTGPTGKGTGTTEIKPKNTTLYVLLEKEQPKPKEGDLIIEESQVTKAVETMTSSVTGWGPQTMTFKANDISGACPYMFYHSCEDCSYSWQCSAPYVLNDRAWNYNHNIENNTPLIR